MKKWILIFIGIILIGIIGVGIKINSDLNDLAKAFSLEHSLNEKNLLLLSDSISPNKKFRYYEYQFDKGGLGYSRIYWAVLKNEQNRNNLKNGIIPNGYKIVRWTTKNELLLSKWKPYYDKNATWELKNGTKINGVKIKIEE